MADLAITSGSRRLQVSGVQGDEHKLSFYRCDKPALKGNKQQAEAYDARWGQETACCHSLFLICRPVLFLVKPSSRME